jgi:hypothetical protein
MAENNVPQDAFRPQIPGISWTVPPKTYAWQKPPKFASVAEVAQDYITRLSNKEVLDDLLDTIDNGMPIATIAESIMLGGVSAGVHTIDAGILVTPVIIEMLKTAAEVEGIDYHMFLEDKLPKKEKPMSERLINKTIKMAMENMQEESNVAEPSAPTSVEGGLMSKRK